MHYLGVPRALQLSLKAPNVVLDIWSGRNGGLEISLWALDAMGANIVFLTETNLTHGIYTRSSSGYLVTTTDATSAHQGRVVFCWRANDAYEV